MQSDDVTDELPARFTECCFTNRVVLAEEEATMMVYLQLLRTQPDHLV